jgi:lycopene cyclase domain-containing protein
MNMSFLYLVSFLVILIPALLLLFTWGHKRLSKHWHVIVYVGLIGVIFAASESIALKWQLWQYNDFYILPTRIFNAQLETYILNLLVFMAIACSTILLMRKSKKSKNR